MAFVDGSIEPDPRLKGPLGDESDQKIMSKLAAAGDPSETAARETMEQYGKGGGYEGCKGCYIVSNKAPK